MLQVIRSLATFLAPSILWKGPFTPRLQKLSDHFLSYLSSSHWDVFVMPLRHFRAGWNSEAPLVKGKLPVLISWCQVTASGSRSRKDGKAAPCCTYRDVISRVVTLLVQCVPTGTCCPWAGCQWCGDGSAGNLLEKFLMELIRRRLMGKISFFCQMAKPREFYPEGEPLSKLVLQQPCEWKTTGEGYHIFPVYLLWLLSDMKEKAGGE